MDDTAVLISEPIDRVSRDDSTLKWINLAHRNLRDEDMNELADCLLAHPNSVVFMRLCHNQLTDTTGVKLARYVAASSTIQSLSLSNNQLGTATYLAFAAALRVNISLRCLYLYGNQPVDKNRIDTTFVKTFMLNPNRSAYSAWRLYSNLDDFPQLKKFAEESGHPDMQALLTMQLI